MSLRLVRRGGTRHFYIRGTIRGIRVWETSGTDDPKIAEAVRIKREGELLNLSVFGAAVTKTFADAALSYLQHGGEARFLGKQDPANGNWTGLLGQFYGNTLSEIGQAQIDAAAIALYPHASNATRRRQVYTPMAAVLHHAATKGWIRAPIIRLPKVKQAETRYSTIDRMNKLLPHCSPQLRRLIVFLAYTGARISECLRLDWEADVDLSRKTATIRRTKNGKTRTVHLPVAVLVELGAVPDSLRRGPVFHWKARQAVYKPLRRACRLAGVEYMPTHQQGRHTFAAGLRIHAKRDLRGLMEDGGWDSVQSVMRYMHLVPGESVEAVDKLPQVQNLSSSDDDLTKSLKSRKNDR